MENYLSVHPAGIPDNRRKGADIILKSLDRLSAVLWGFTALNLCLILYAKPQWETFFDRILHTAVRRYWNFGLLRLVIVLSVIEFLVGFFSLYLNSKRLKRKGDRIRESIVVSIFLSLLVNISLTILVYA